MADRQGREFDGAEVPDAAVADHGLLLMGEEATVVQEWVATTKVRIHKRIVTDIQTIEVEVRREEIVVTPEPLPGHEAYVIDVGHAPVHPEPLVYVLRAEVPSVSLHILPVERVTLEVHAVGGEQELTVALQSERLELSHEPAVIASATPESATPESATPESATPQLGASS